MPKTLQIYGPFFTNYSLARVNRGFALALSKIQKDYNVKIFGDKDKIDYFPTAGELSQRDELNDLVSLESLETDIIIYNNFPKNIGHLHGLKELRANIKIGYFAWEESIYPKIWVDEINSNLHALFASSSFSKEIFKRSGIKIPIYVVPNALNNSIEHKPVEYKLNTEKKFKFLHISTAKKRKGVDALLKAYLSEFTINDNVTLVLKTFPGPDNEVERLISENIKENSPEIIHINSPDLTEEDLTNLHFSADAEVYPTRAEGFGLPILEAMNQGTPVIATNYSGHLDFCNSENSFLIDYKLEYAKDSELLNIGAKWAEPDIEDLRSKMRYLYENIDSKEVKTIIKNAKKTAGEYTWENSAESAYRYLKEIEEFARFKDLNAAVITPFNDETGIAEYSKKLYSSIEKSFKNLYYISNKDIADQVHKDSENVKRLMEIGEKSFREVLEFLEVNEVRIVHIQYHSGAFFPLDSLDSLVKKLKDKDIKVFVTFHAFKGVGFDYLKDLKNLELVDKIFIHNLNDYNYAKTKLSNVELLLLPTQTFTKREKFNLREKLGISKDEIIIASHGLMNTNKNIPQIIEALHKLKNPKIKFFAVNAVSTNNIHSSGIYEECKKLVKEYRLEDKIVFFTDFLNEHMVEILLQASDLIIFNYSEVGESASAAIRKAIASNNPVICTDINMFSEFKNEVLKIKDTSPKSVAVGIEKILEDKALQSTLVKNSQKFVEDNLYEKKALQTIKIYS